MPSHIGFSVRRGRLSRRALSPRGRNRSHFSFPAWVALFTLFSLALAACSGAKKGPFSVPRPVDPTTVAEFEIDGWAWTDNPANVISPDGKHVLAILNNEERKAVAVIPIEGASHDAKIVHQAPAGWTEADGLDYRTLGWTRDGIPLFVVFGHQNRGPNTGKRGAGIWSGGAQEAAEIAFIDLPDGNLYTSVYLPEEDKVLVAVSTAIYSYDRKANRLTSVKAGLPEYGGLFYAWLSPDGKHFVYELYEEGKSGIYILDAVSGKEEVLLATGETFSFVPQWSPDGKYVAAYTADLKSGAEGSSVEDYDCFLSTAGPLTIAPAITIVDTSGEVVRTVRVEGKYLANMKWSHDSKSIAFVAGDRPAVEENPYDDMGIPNIKWDGVWTVKISEGSVPLRISLVAQPAGQGPSFVYPCDFDTASEKVFFQYGDMEKVYVWWNGPGKGASTEFPLPGMKVADGYWHPQYTSPQYGEYLVALISGNETTELWLLGCKEIRKADYWSSAFATVLLGFNEDTILLFQKGEEGPAKILVISMYGA